MTNQQIRALRAEAIDAGDTVQAVACDVALGDVEVTDETDDGEGYEADINEARAWARSAEDGDYLVEYEDTGMTDVEDVGSRCGYDDFELAEIESILRARDLTLRADDVGLQAASR